MFRKWKFFIVLGSFCLLSGCSKEVKVMEEKISDGGCLSEEINIEGYGDKGKKLANCFVEYPREPSRQDKSYYIVDDICGQFTPEFVSNALEKKISMAGKNTPDGSYTCTYSWNDLGGNITIILDYLNIKNQKAGQEDLGRKVEEESSIPMKNMVVYQENGLINTIYLILDEEKFISIERSNMAGLNTNELINFAAKVGKEIKNYK